MLFFHLISRKAYGVFLSPAMPGVCLHVGHIPVWTNMFQACEAVGPSWTPTPPPTSSNREKLRLREERMRV